MAVQAFEGLHDTAFAAVSIVDGPAEGSVANQMMAALSEAPSSGYDDRVTVLMDFKGDDLTDALRRTGKRLTPNGRMLVYLLGAFEVRDGQITVSGPPPTTLDDCLRHLVGASPPDALVLMIDNLTASRDVHQAAVEAVSGVDGLDTWCVIHDGPESGSWTPDDTLLADGLVDSIGRVSGRHIAHWVSTADLYRASASRARSVGRRPPIMTTSGDAAVTIAYVDRVEPPRFSETLEVALSGGGYRASAVSLGALLYLVHAGLNTQVDSIVSVSGGSITNGWIAQREEYKTLASVDAFAPSVQGLAERISHRSLVSLKNPYLALWAGALAVAIALAVAALATASLTAAGLIPPLLALFLIATIVHGRGIVVTAWLGRTFFPKTKPQLISDLSHREIDHVICATDIGRGEPLFFSTRPYARIFSETLRIRPDPAARLTVAVRASAALPPLIPPQRVRVPPGADGTTSSQAVWLSDGGVWNNLGTDWSRLRQEIMTAEYDRLKKAEGKTFEEMLMEPDEVAPSGGVRLVIDASGPLKHGLDKALWIPGFGSMLTAARTLLVSYASTVAGRLPHPTAARGRMLLNPQRWWVDWPQPPMTMNEQPGTAEPLELVVRCADPGEIAKTWSIVGLTKHWETVGTRYEAEMNRAIPGLAGVVIPGLVVGTTLNALTPATTLALIVDGYLATRETLVAAFANHNAPPVPDAAWFVDLVRASAERV